MFELRVNKVKQKLEEQNLDAVLVSSVANITYLSGYANFSKEEREAYIFIGKNFAYIITDGRYSEVITRQIPHLQLFERGGQKTTTGLFKKHPEIKSLGIEENSLTVSEHKNFKKHFKKLKDFKIGRNIKDKKEIFKIEKACQLGDRVFEFILKKIRPGISEKELAFAIELFIKQQGGELSFPAIVAFGANSSVPHHQAGDTKLKKGDFLLLDFGVKLKNYCSDMTRTVFFGTPSEKQKKIYQAVSEAQKKAIELIQKGERKASRIDKVARDYIISQDFPNIPHSLGHGIGLEVHESPHLSQKSRDILKEGVVFSIEPGIYLPGFGGVRIEDLFVLEKEGLQQLTTSKKILTTI